MLEVPGDEHICLSSDGSCQDMRIIRVGQAQRLDERLIPVDQGIWDSRVHQPPGPGQPFGRQIGAVQQQVPGPFVLGSVQRAATSPEVARWMSRFRVREGYSTLAS